MENDKIPLKTAPVNGRNGPKSEVSELDRRALGTYAAPFLEIDTWKTAPCFFASRFVHHSFPPIKLTAVGRDAGLRVEIRAAARMRAAVARGDCRKKGREGDSERGAFRNAPA